MVPTGYYIKSYTGKKIKRKIKIKSCTAHKDTNKLEMRINIQFSVKSTKLWVVFFIFEGEED